MIFFVPLIAVLCVPRLLPCRRPEPLPATRIRDVLRGCRVVLAGVGLTLGSQWVSFMIGDNRAAWNGATWLQVAVLCARVVRRHPLWAAFACSAALGGSTLG